MITLTSARHSALISILAVLPLLATPACVSTRARVVEHNVPTPHEETRSVAEPTETALAFVSKELTEGVQFEFGKADVSAESEAHLRELATLLRQDPDQRLRLDGFTDNTGTETFNLELSRRRAEAVQKILLDAGVNANQIRVEGHGEEQPVAENTSDGGRAKNRRVELTVEIA